MNIPVRLNKQLALGRRKLRTVFGNSAPRTLKAGEILGTASDSDGEIYHLRTGWACQFSALANGCRAIVDVYLPGDVIGLDTLLRTRPLENVLTSFRRPDWVGHAESVGGRDCRAYGHDQNLDKNLRS